MLAYLVNFKGILLFVLSYANQLLANSLMRVQISHLALNKKANKHKISKNILQKKSLLNRLHTVLKIKLTSI